MAIEFYNEIKSELQALGFEITNEDFNRPWGAFFYINENQAQEFSDRFFRGLDVNKLRISGKLSPKILMVKPNVKLSWQYHNRRAEIWQVYKGVVGVIKSTTDDEGPIEILNPGDQIKLQQGIRHRLVGLKDYGVVAEIWQHTDPVVPSDEDDIIRVQDDFGR
jgi:mannose-6-phosphate isomerase-like protein (cupin superfamily)